MANKAVTSKGKQGAISAIGADLRKADGQLIVRSVPIQAPDAPKCVRFKCLWKFVKDVWFCAVLSKYHTERTEYAQHGNRDKDIKEKYRTGEPSPKNTKQAIIAIIGLRIYKLRR